MKSTDYQVDENFNQAEKRPTGLTVLCILTFIGSGFFLLAYLLFFGAYNTLPDLMDAMSEVLSGSFSDMYRRGAEIMRNTPRYAYLAVAAPYLVSIVGAAAMFAMRKIGFHLYVAAQALVIFLPMHLLNEKFIPTGLFLAAAFVLLYFHFYKKMK